MKKRKTKVLVIDNEPLVLDVLKDFFGSFLFFRVFTAKNGDEGINKIEENNPDLVVTDVDMPVKNGIEVAMHVLKKGDRTHIVIMSGGHVNEKLKKFISTRKLPFLNKPVSLVKLKEIVSGFTFAE
jgi:two-component system, response regulator YesN